MAARRLTAFTTTLLATVLLLAAAGCETGEPGAGRPSPTPTAVPLPASMAALGDSITRAVSACEEIGNCAYASWSTGTAGGLGSHYQRLTDDRGRPPELHNFAVSGAQVAELPAQAREAVIERVDYVTVLIGANDACAPDERSMTPVAAYEAAFVRALGTLRKGLPQARILVVSIPDLHQLWRLGKDRRKVRAAWDGFGICRSMLADPTSTSAAARARRDRVRDRVVAYNRVMAQACGRHPGCRWDGGAVFGYRFSLKLVSPYDYFHPSEQGQRTLARLTWDAGFWA